MPINLRMAPGKCKLWQLSFLAKTVKQSPGPLLMLVGQRRPGPRIAAMKSSTRQCYLARTAQVLSHIEEALDDELSLEELARRAYMAPFHFHKVFRQIVGLPVQCYIRQLRLNRAAHLLATSDRRILDIALAAHYQSNEAFTRAFKKRFGISPSRFRDQAASLAPDRIERAEPGWPEEELPVPAPVPTPAPGPTPAAVSAPGPASAPAPPAARQGFARPPAELGMAASEPPRGGKHEVFL
jgi:AraC-like DNA-binding protein